MAAQDRADLMGYALTRTLAGCVGSVVFVTTPALPDPNRSSRSSARIARITSRGRTWRVRGEPGSTAT
jgi:hypothetical protein